MRSLRRDPTKYVIMYVFASSSPILILLFRIVESEQTLEIIPVQYVVPTTKAVMTYHSSLEKIYQFCATLPTDQYQFC
jgi:hypothetical protein